jgi:iron(III) transport system substrate-binding protein
MTRSWTGRPRRALASVTAITAGAILLAACGTSGTTTGSTAPAAGKPQTEAQLRSAAEQEGQLNWYTTFASDDVTDMVKAFNKIYPKIKVNPLRLSADELPTKIITEQRGNEFNADVVSGDSPQLDALIDAGAMQPYCPPDEQPLPGGQTLPKGYCGNVYVLTTTIAYNPKALQRLGLKPPTSYADLTQPQWRGQFSFDPGSVNFYEALITQMGHTKALNLVKALGANQPKLVSSHTLALTQVEAGEPAVTATAYGYKSASEKAKKGASLEFVNTSPLPTSFTPIDVVRKAPHMAAAELFDDWMVSQQGQQAIIDQTNHTSLRTDVHNDPSVWDPTKWQPVYGAADITANQYNQWATELKQALGDD